MNKKIKDLQEDFHSAIKDIDKDFDVDGVIESLHSQVLDKIDSGEISFLEMALCNSIMIISLQMKKIQKRMAILNSNDMAIASKLKNSISFDEDCMETKEEIKIH